MSEEKTLTISTKHYLLTYDEFISEIESKLEAFSRTKGYHCDNMTAKKHAGWTENLYEASITGAYVIYDQNRTWTYHDNGTSGTGLTLDDAILDWKSKYFS